jgi:hypothetical protein
MSDQSLDLLELQRGFRTRRPLSELRVPAGLRCQPSTNLCLNHAVTGAEPARALVAQMDGGLTDLREERWRQCLYAPLFADPEPITALQIRVDALDPWRQRANGHQLPPTQVIEMNNRLFVANDSISELIALRRALFDNPDTTTIIHRANRAVEGSRGPELSIG